MVAVTSYAQDTYTVMKSYFCWASLFKSVWFENFSTLKEERQKSYVNSLKFLIEGNSGDFR